MIQQVDATVDDEEKKSGGDSRGSNRYAGLGKKIALIGSGSIGRNWVWFFEFSGCTFGNGSGYSLHIVDQ